MRDSDSDVHGAFVPDGDGSSSSVKFADQTEKSDPPSEQEMSWMTSSDKPEESDEGFTLFGSSRPGDSSDEPESAEPQADPFTPQEVSENEEVLAEPASEPAPAPAENQEDDALEAPIEEESTTDASQGLFGVAEEKPEDEPAFDSQTSEEADETTGFQPATETGEAETTDSDEEELPEFGAPVDVNPVEIEPADASPVAAFSATGSAPAPTTPRPVRQTETEEAPASSGSAIAVMVLFTWASLASIVALWLWMNRPEQASPLENLPDDGIKTSSDIISPLERLTGKEMFSLGETKQIGNLAITPLAIEYQALELADSGNRITTDPLLLLKLKVQNVSDDQSFHPTDPVYYYPDRRKKLKDHKQFNRRGYTYTFLHPKGSFKELYFCYDLPFDIGIAAPGQTFPKLGPGEEAVVSVISEELALDELSDQMVWRIKLRKGKTRGGKGVATVIGVQFKKSDIQAS